MQLGDRIGNGNREADVLEQGQVRQVVSDVGALRCLDAQIGSQCVERRNFVLAAEYDVRHNFERDDAEIRPGNPIGQVLPAFTVHNVRAGVRVAQRGGFNHRLTVAVTNLTNTLYAEFSNILFFRPEPGRGVTVSYEVTF